MNGMPTQAPLDLPLRDIHLPEPVSWWPPAPGWWLLAGLLILLATSVLLMLRWHRRGRLGRSARSALERVFGDYRHHGDPQRLLRELSVLLRRIALSYFPRTQVASLSGEAWLEFLDRGLAGSVAPGGFRQGPGRVLAEGPFAPSAEAVAVSALERLCQAWLDGIVKSGEHATGKSRRVKGETRSRIDPPSGRMLTVHAPSLRRERDVERVVEQRS